MTTKWKSVFRSTLIGVGATATMDLGGETIRHLTGVPPLNYGLVGRWIGHMPQGQFRHDNIGAAAPVRHEMELGLVAHYSIGITIAALLTAIRPKWANRPTIGPAMAAGLGSTIAPLVLMQPAFGLGLAASKTPEPTVSRLRTTRAHTIYGLGLYLTARVLARFPRAK